MLQGLTQKPDFCNSEPDRLLSVANLIQVVGLLRTLKNILRKIVMHFKILQILWSFEGTVVNILNTRMYIDYMSAANNKKQ
jgi:hypothetical protein